jgi:CheY-like chemotaxis protein
MVVRLRISVHALWKALSLTTFATAVGLGGDCRLGSQGSAVEQTVCFATSYEKSIQPIGTIQCRSGSSFTMAKGKWPMTCRILIVEDQPLIALCLEEAVIELGHKPAGMASTKSKALALGANADVALVDVDLLDGPTGPEIGKRLAEKNVSVVFMTGNPASLGDGVPGTLGVISKPLMDIEMIEAIRYAVDRHENRVASSPRRMVEFS